MKTNTAFISNIAGLLMPDLSPKHRIFAGSLLVFVFLLVTWVVYLGGGTKSSYTTLILLPGLYAAAIFGTQGGLVAGIAAGLLLGPYMPLDTTLGIYQDHFQWLLRMLNFTIAAVLAGLLFDQLKFLYNAEKQQSATNSITDLPNERGLKGYLRQLSNNGEAQRLLLVNIEISDYKRLTTTIGLDFEAQLQQGLAAIFHEFSDESHGKLFHTNNDNFAILYAGDNSNRQIIKSLRQLIQKFNFPVYINEAPLHLEIHIGLAIRRATSELNTKEFVNQARAATNQGITNKKNIYLFNRILYLKNRETLQLIGDFRRALEKNELSLVYQPKINFRSGSTVGFEALARWNHNIKGAINPLDFIPHIEQSALIYPFTEWVLRTAISDLKGMVNSHSGLHIGINVSPENFKDRKFASNVLRILKDLEFPPKQLDIELTETALVNNYGNITNQLTRLTNSGITLSIDDFGTGFSSLTHLTELPVTTIKLDQSFVRKLETNRTNYSVIKFTILMAQYLDIKTVAEGVESRKAAHLLNLLGCNTMQGYYFGKPMPAHALTDWLSTHTQYLLSDQQTPPYKHTIKE